MYIAYNLPRFSGKVISTGQCVAFVENAAYTPTTHSWKQGVKVKNNALLQKGVAIATFQNGRYQNRVNGDSHAAIYLYQTAIGIYVMDQWKNPDGTFHPVGIRLIRFRHGLGKPANDGDAYWVIQ